MAGRSCGRPWAKGAQEFVDLGAQVLQDMAVLFPVFAELDSHQSATLK